MSDSTLPPWRPLGEPSTPLTPPPIALTPPPLTPPVVTPPPVPAPVSDVAATSGAPTGEPLIQAPDRGPVPTEPPSSGGRPAWIAAVVASVALLFGGGWFALNAFAASGGGETPEEAMELMLEALGNEDFIAMGELIDPSERRSIAEPVLTEMLPELERLGILDESFDESNVEGVDFEFVAPSYRIEPVPLTADFVHVIVDSGESTSSFDPSAFPFGDLVRDRFAAEIESADIEVDTADMATDADNPLVLVERDGRWYFSLFYTAAENARLEVGEPAPSVADMPARLGSESPEAAVNAMLAAISDLDIAAMIGRTDPSEMDVLYRYSPLFLEESQAEIDEFLAEFADDGVFWNITDVTTEVVRSDGDEAVVEITSLTLVIETPDINVSVTYGKQLVSANVGVSIDEFSARGQVALTPQSFEVSGSFDGEEAEVLVQWSKTDETINLTGRLGAELFEGSVSFSDQCTRYNITIEGETEAGCVEDEIGDDGSAAVELYRQGLQQLPDEFPGIPMTTNKVDGEWYVAPISTGMDGFVTWLQSLDRTEVETWLEELDSMNELESFVS